MDAFLLLFLIIYLAGVGLLAWHRYNLTARWPRRRWPFTNDD